MLITSIFMLILIYVYQKEGSKLSQTPLQKILIYLLTYALIPLLSIIFALVYVTGFWKTD